MHFNIADWFIVERLLAALCGMLFQVDDEKLTLEIADHVEETFFKNVPTTHVLILDYADTILDYTANKYGYERTIDAIETEQLQEWQLDEACMKTIQDDDQVEVLGYGPISKDFAKYIIGYGLMYRGYNLGETSPVKKASQRLFGE